MRTAPSIGAGSRNLAGDDNPLTLKLSHFLPLAEIDRHTLDELLAGEVAYPADTDIVGEGTVPRSVFALKEGMAIRYRLLPDGGRQIMTFLIAGDLCDTHVSLLEAMDHAIGTITPVRVAPIPREAILALFAGTPRLAAALRWSALQEEAMLRERIVSLGRRDARGRVAYLLCELLCRHQAVGLSDGTIIRLPLTQTELADALGLTPVHVNRVLKEFRERRLITLDRKKLHILDSEGLHAVAGFNHDYLRLDGASEETRHAIEALERRQRAGRNPPGDGRPLDP